MLMQICCLTEDLVCAWVRVLWIKGSAVHTALSIFCFQIVYDDIAYMRKKRGSYMKKAYIKKGREKPSKKKKPMLPQKPEESLVKATQEPIQEAGKVLQKITEIGRYVNPKDLECLKGQSRNDYETKDRERP